MISPTSFNFFTWPNTIEFLSTIGGGYQLTNVAPLHLFGKEIVLRSKLNIIVCPCVGSIFIVDNVEKTCMIHTF
jgi:hypothetical protein